MFGDDSNAVCGADTFVFDAALWLTEIDRIADFSVVDDTAHLACSVFGGLVAGAPSGVEFEANLTGGARLGTARIVYETDTGKQSFDPDGAGGAARVQLATLTAKLASFGSGDFFVV